MNEEKQGPANQEPESPGTAKWVGVLVTVVVLVLVKLVMG